MIRTSLLRLVTWTGLLLFVACQPASPATSELPAPTEPSSPGGAAPSPLPSTAVTPSPSGEKEGSPPPGDGKANADVLHVRAVQDADGTWTFHVTVQHPDTGWEDYADGWDVLTPDGEVLKPDPDSPFTRLLLHPHENEQPFTRSQSSIAVPPDVAQVRVRAHDLVDGFGGREVTVDLATPSGPDFEVIRSNQ